MDIKRLNENCSNYMRELCENISERTVGTAGNLEATDFFVKTISRFGWKTDLQKFKAIDWIENGACLKAGNNSFKVFVSPYSLGFCGQSELAVVSKITELEKGDFRNKILLLYGEIAKEQLMPKNFVFYNPERHKRIVSLLEKSGVKAIISATARNSALAGGVYPFPMIEDGDFNIPSVYMTEDEGERLLSQVGKKVYLKSDSQRIPSHGYNVIAKKNMNKPQKIVVTAHIDAKKNSPGAIDNATGVTILLVLAELLTDFHGDKQIEIVAFNGEDYYAVPGQMKYIEENRDNFDMICLNINIDGAAYKYGKSSFSFFNLPENINKVVNTEIKKYSGIVEGIQWPQGDHSIFTQMGKPAVAVSSEWFIKNIDNQDITHTPKDNLKIVDYQKIIEIATAINSIIRKL